MANIFRIQMTQQMANLLRIVYIIRDIIQSMNSDEVIKSIYNPKRKTKQALVFPKICKAESNPTQKKVFGKVVSRKYNNQNIFKVQDEKKEKAKIFQQQRLRQYHNRQYQELQNKINDLIKKHAQDLRQIQQKQSRIVQSIEQEKKKLYPIKYNIWQTKNQIMNLNALYLEEEKEYERLCAYFQQQEQEYELQGQPQEDGEYQQENENGQQIQMNEQQQADMLPFQQSQQIQQDAHQQNI